MRVALAGAVVLASCALLAACADESTRIAATEPPSTRLDARPTRADGGRCTVGEHELVGGERSALLRVTPRATNGRRVLLLALHGAGSGGAPGGLHAFRGVWDVPGLVLVAPAARGSAWSLERADIAFVDRALRLAFARCSVRVDRVLVGGFSSGAGMALWLGLTNGDLFHAIVALSPGSSLPSAREGRPQVYLAHGVRDGVIPISAGSDVVAKRLRADGYRVRYIRFPGGHRPRPGIVRELIGRAAR